MVITANGEPANPFPGLRYDTRGPGGTKSLAGSHILEMLGENAVALLDALKVQRVHFVGLSIGGMIGQYLGLNHPLEGNALMLSSGPFPKKSSEPQVAHLNGEGTLLKILFEKRRGLRVRIAGIKG
jgi:pimeloyl-ACP methyl ester carboxylesterase